MKNQKYRPKDPTIPVDKMFYTKVTDYLRMNTLFNATIMTDKGVTQSFKIPRLGHEDMLILYAIVAVFNFNDDEIKKAINQLTNPNFPPMQESKDAYDLALHKVTKLTINDFYNKYSIPKEQFCLLSGNYSFCDKRHYIRSGFLKTKNPTANFVAAMTWYMLMIFGKDNLINKIVEARQFINNI